MSALCLLVAGAALFEGFLNPPRECFPETWFQVSGGNASRAGATADLEAIAAAGFSGIQYFHEGFGKKAEWPGMTTPQIPCMSPRWEDFVAHLGDECRRLGLRLLMHSCPGWSMAGGPWIPADRTMRELVISSGTNLAAKATDAPWRDYRDICYVAFPTPVGDVMKPLVPVAVRGTRTSDRRTVRAYYCEQALKLPPDDEAKSAANWREATMGAGKRRFAFPDEPGTVEVELDYGRLVTVRTLELSSVQAFNHFWSFQPDVTAIVEAERDGAFAEIARRAMPQSTWQDEKPISLAIDETTARRFRVKLEHRHALALSSVRFYSGARPDNWEADVAAVLRARMHGIDPKTAPGAIVDPSQIRLSREVPSVPSGWTVLRIGNVNSGIRNHPAPPEATGWECDKLAPEGADAHYAGYVGKLTAAGGPLADGKLAGFLMDSWECEAQNWTPGLDRLFAERYGYALDRWWPVLAGLVVESREATALFCRDWREFLGDLVADRFYGRMAELAHAHGQVITYETCGGDVFPSDPMRHWKHADVPMCEFWRPRTREGGVGSIDFKAIRPCVSAARLYGKRRVAAEALTTSSLAPWSSEHPRSYKADLDWYFGLGVTHMVFENYTHNPQVGFLPPGASFSPVIGSRFLRGQTWWPAMRDFNAYLARAQFLLESGRAVSDVLLYLGDAVDHKPPHFLPFPEGLGYDYLNRDALMTRLAVKDGLWTTPEGMTWKALWLYDETWLRPETKRRMAEAEAAGAKVIRGDIFAGVKRLGLKPQVKVPPTFAWQHRTTADEEIYYFAEENGRPFRGKVSVAGSGEAFVADPVTGEVTPADDVAFADGYSEIGLDLPPSGARFVILRRGAPIARHPAPARPVRTLAVTGPWTLTFAKGWGVDAPVTVNRLLPWNELSLSEEGKAYSGTVTYETSFDWPGAADADAELSLGQVEVIAEVWLNGRRLGRAWTWPYRLKVGDALRPGRNELKVAVTGTWQNRLQYDLARPEAERKTWTTAWPQPGESAERSGLFGPVAVETR